VKDLNYGVELGVDHVAVSFTREARNIAEVKKILKEKNAEHISVIAKIEDGLGVQNLESILEIADGVMIARGDMGVCLDRAEVPLIQRRMIRRCREAGRPVIVATQMLDSMITNPHPTRAEVTDVSEAVMQGADAVMLSNETAVGLHPVRVVEEMVKIVKKVESSPEFERVLKARRVYPPKPNLSQALGLAIDQLSEVMGGKAIVCFTKSGKSAKMLSSYRPLLPIIAVTQSEKVAKSLIPFWGVEGEIVSEVAGEDFLLKQLVDKGLLKKGDLTILTSDVKEEPLGATIRVAELR
jgi:pyruvate kinase